MDTTTKATAPVTEASANDAPLTPAAEKVEEEAQVNPPTVSEELVAGVDQLATRVKAVGWAPVREGLRRFFTAADAFLDGLGGESTPKKKG